MNYPKRLIEVDLPIKRISEHARREKSIRHGHISTLHIWWARRPLAACRAVLCAALWPDPVDEHCPPAFRAAAAKILCEFAEKVREDITLAELCGPHFKYWQRVNPSILKADWISCPVMRYYLLDFIADFANWDASTNPVFLETARALTKAAHESLGGMPDTRPLVVDPFAGGGAIPLEALRVGADAFASDLNPIPVLLNKVVLEYIPRYGQQLANEIRKWGMWIKERLEHELAEFYPKDPDGATPIAYLWARTVTCEGPACGAEVPLMRTLWLSKKSNRSTALRLIPNLRDKKIDFEIIQNAKIRDVEEGTIKRGVAKCPICGYTTPVTSIRRQLQDRRGGVDDSRLFVVVTTQEGQQKRFYRLATVRDMQIVAKAKDILKQYQKEYQELINPVPDELLPPQGTLGFRVQLYGMTRWGDLFTSRQALALTRLIAIVKEAGINLSNEHDKNFAKAVQTCLGLAVNRIIDRTSSLCTWRPQADQEKVEHVFTRQTLSMTWDFAEGNLLSSGTAGWSDAYEAPAMLIETLSETNLPSGTSIQASATAHHLSNDAANAFITDPPYYDAVPYADLSDFFYVWLKRSIGNLYPDLFASGLTPKDDECVVDEVKGHDKAYYEDMMGQAMAEGCRILDPSGICTVVFAHKSTSGWEAQLQSMVDAGWTITGSWPIDTEMGTRLRAMDSAALASSIHLVCRPRKNPDGSLRTDDVGDWRDVLQELPRRIHDWMPRLAREGIVGADAIFSCLGPALEIFSRYSSVERADGTPVTLKEYLEYVWAAVSREALNTIFQGADTSSFEPDARLTAVWLWTLSTSNGKNGNGNGKNQKQANGTNAQGEETTADDLEEEEEEDIGPKPGISGYAMAFDTARKLAQGLGVHLDKMGTLVEIKGSTARLRSPRERARFLFNKSSDDLSLARPRKRAKPQQLSMFQEQELAEELTSMGEIPEFTPGSTILDRMHQAMLLYGAGDTDALRRFLKEEGVGSDQRFWKLAVALSSLYPRHSEERRWVDGVQNQKKSLGL